MTKLGSLTVGWGVLLCSVSLCAALQTDELKFTFSHPPDQPPPSGGGLPPDAAYPKGRDSREQGPFANIVSHKISAVTVTWSDKQRFKADGQVEGLLREVLISVNTNTFTFHAWSFPDLVPSVMATVEHVKGKPGRWAVWCPSLRWAYQDGDGEWWWGVWSSYAAPAPQVCGPVEK